MYTDYIYAIAYVDAYCFVATAGCLIWLKTGIAEADIQMRNGRLKC